MFLVWSCCKPVGVAFVYTISEQEPLAGGILHRGFQLLGSWRFLETDDCSDIPVRAHHLARTSTLKNPAR